MSKWQQEREVVAQVAAWVRDGEGTTVTVTTRGDERLRQERERIATALECILGRCPAERAIVAELAALERELVAELAAFDAAHPEVLEAINAAHSAHVASRTIPAGGR